MRKELLSPILVTIGKQEMSYHLEYGQRQGIFQNALAKGPATTTWIWNLHAEPHDFGIQQLSSAANTARMIFAVHLAHLIRRLSLAIGDAHSWCILLEL